MAKVFLGSMKAIIMTYLLLCWLIGIAFIVLGSWLHKKNSDLGMYSIIGAEYYNRRAKALTALSITLGCLTILLAFVACFAFLRPSLCGLRIFLLWLIIMVLGGFILTILGIIFPKQSHSHWKEDLENTLSKGIERYRDDRRMMDYAHQNNKCCGMYGFHDWEDNIYFSCDSRSPERCSVPDSCCIAPEEINGEFTSQRCGQAVLRLDVKAARSVVYTRGCVDAVLDEADREMLQPMRVMAYSSSILSAMQIFGLLLGGIWFKKVNSGTG